MQRVQLPFYATSFDIDASRGLLYAMDKAKDVIKMASIDSRNDMSQAFYIYMT